MKSKLTTMLLLLAISLTAMKCEKDKVEPKPVLPAETQSGKNTFGCLVNGEVWLPRGNFPYAGLNATIQFDILNLAANKGNKSSIFIVIRNLKNIGEYSLSDTIYASYAFADNEDDAISGKINITKYDTTTQIISGRFYFTVIMKDGQTVEITDGRFDLKYTN